MHSWEERRRRRGALTELEFLAAMHRLGMVAVDETASTFMHPDTGGRRYSVQAPGFMHQGFHQAFYRIEAELNAARGTPKKAGIKRGPFS